VVAEGDGRQLRISARSGDATRANERGSADVRVDGGNVDGLADIEEESSDENRRHRDGDRHQKVRVR